MKNFNQYVTEAGTGPVGNWNQTPLTVNDTDPFDLANPLVLKRINTFVGSIADREYLMPEAAIDQLRNFMMRIGVQFPKVDLPESGSVSLPLSQWGGRFGKDGRQAADEVINDDGITDRIPGGLSLEIKTEAVANGSWKVYAKIK